MFLQVELDKHQLPTHQFTRRGRDSLATAQPRVSA